jgi:excisionase family DNA binding protein
MNVQQIASYLGVSKETIYRMLEKEEIPSYRIGKLWRFDPVQIDQWVKGEKKDVSKSSRKSRKR